MKPYWKVRKYAIPFNKPDDSNPIKSHSRDNEVELTFARSIAFANIRHAPLAAMPIVTIGYFSKFIVQPETAQNDFLFAGVQSKILEDAMTWYVKVRLACGQITTIPKDDFDEAVKLRQEKLAQGDYAWIEDLNGQLVGFTKIKDGKQSR